MSSWVLVSVADGNVYVWTETSRSKAYKVGFPAFGLVSDLHTLLFFLLFMSYSSFLGLSIQESNFVCLAAIGSRIWRLRGSETTPCYPAGRNPVAGEVREQALHHQSCGIRWQGGGKAGGGAWPQQRRDTKAKLKWYLKDFSCLFWWGEFEVVTIGGIRILFAFLLLYSLVFKYI